MEKANVKLGIRTCAKKKQLEKQKKANKKANAKKKAIGKSKKIAKLKQLLFSRCFFPKKMQKKSKTNAKKTAKQMQKKSKKEAEKKQKKSKWFFAFSVAFVLLFVFACFSLFPKVWFPAVHFWIAFLFALFLHFFKRLIFRIKLDLESGDHKFIISELQTQDRSLHFSQVIRYFQFLSSCWCFPVSWKCPEVRARPDTYTYAQKQPKGKHNKKLHDMDRYWLFLYNNL